MEEKNKIARKHNIASEKMRGSVVFDIFNIFNFYKG